MKKQLIEYFVGCVIVMSIVILIISIRNHDDMNLRKLLALVAIVLVGSTVMTLIRYLLLKKLQRNNNKHKQ